MPDLILTLALLVHLIATVVWIGGLALLALVVWPSLHSALGGDPRLPDLLRSIRRRFTPLANLSLVALVVTGLIQMSVNPNYAGMLVFDNTWSKAILLKHIAIAGMVVVGVVMQWRIAPAQERAALLRARGKDTPDSARLERQERRLSALNLLLGGLVLVFTAVATAL